MQNDQLYNNKHLSSIVRVSEKSPTLFEERALFNIRAHIKYATASLCRRYFGKIHAISRLCQCLFALAKDGRKAALKSILTEGNITNGWQT